MKIYVGNVRSGVSEAAIATEFEKFGTVVSVTIPKDSKTGRILGCAFVEMSNDEQAQAAIAQLNGLEFRGCWWSVKQAR